MMGFGVGTGIGGWFWMVGGLAVVAGVVFLIVWAIGLVNRPSDAGSGSRPRPDPLDILRERFARGEITEAEFEQAKQYLGYDR